MLRMTLLGIGAMASLRYRPAGLLVEYASARVMMTNGRPAANVFAAGEIMAGNILGKGYVAGVGMTIGTVFGQIAGREAARHVVG